ncbi:MAG: hypothetical protein ACRC1U_08970, partial [Vibrionaceae bacterium]
MSIGRNSPTPPPPLPRDANAAGQVQQGPVAPPADTEYAAVNIIRVRASDAQVETNSTTSSRRSLGSRVRDFFRSCFSCYRRGESSASRRSSDASGGNVNRGFEGDGDGGLHYADIQHGSGAGSRDVDENGMHYAALQGLSDHGSASSSARGSTDGSIPETEYAELPRPVQTGAGGTGAGNATETSDGVPEGLYGRVDKRGKAGKTQGGEQPSTSREDLRPPAPAPRSNPPSRKGSTTSTSESTPPPLPPKQGQQTAGAKKTPGEKPVIAPKPPVTGKPVQGAGAGRPAVAPKPMLAAGTEEPPPPPPP